MRGYEVMSTAVLETETPEPPKPLPAGINHLLTYWWLTIACAGLAAWAFWPELPVVSTSDKAGVTTVTGFGSGVFWLVLIGLLALGSFAGYTIVSQRRVGLTILKIGTFVAMGLGVAFLVLAALKDRKEGFTGLFEPVPLYVGTLLALAVLLPLVFGMMTLLTLSSADDINEHFTKPETQMIGGGTGQYIVPSAIAGAAAGTGAVAAAETLAYRESGGDIAEPPGVESPVIDAAFDEAVEEAVAEHPASEGDVNIQLAETQQLHTPIIDPQSASEMVVEAEESPPTEAETEVFEFEMAPDEDQPPEEPKKTTK
jgi:hypothetical protein